MAGVHGSGVEKRIKKRMGRRREYYCEGRQVLGEVTREGGRWYTTLKSGFHSGDQARLKRVHIGKPSQDNLSLHPLVYLCVSHSGSCS